jgi:hypothetical protein
MTIQLRLLMTTLVTLAIAGCLDGAFAKNRKQGAKPPTTSIMQENDGTPIIMKGYQPRRATQETQPRELVQKRADQPRQYRRGSSTYITPALRSPSSLNNTTVSVPSQPYRPAPITTFSDRVTGAIHSYPLDRGLGNNPIDQQMYIRQRANGL